MKTTKFKPSEIGPIPEDWEVKRLGDVGDFKNGISKGADAFGHGVHFVNLLDVFGKSLLNSADGLGLVEATQSEIVDCGLKQGDALFVRSSVKPEGVGLVTVVGGDLPNTVFSGFLLRYRTEELTTGYMRYAFAESQFRQRVIASSTVSANTNINQTALKRMCVPVPPRAEQEKIAEALSDVDELLAAMTTLIEKKRAIKQGAMQELLEVRPTALTQRTQSSQRGAKGFSHGERGEHGEEKTYAPRRRLAGFTGAWVEKRLGDVADFMTATVPTQTIDTTWYIGTENMLANKMGVAPNNANVPYQNVRGYHIGDVLTSNIRPYLKKIWLADRNGGCSTDVLVIRSKDLNACIPEFLKMVLSHDAFFDFAMANAVGTKMPRGDKKVLINYEFYMPSLAEQQAIAGVLADMDAEIAALEAKRAKYEQIKQGMMQELLTGKTRLEAKHDR